MQNLTAKQERLDLRRVTLPQTNVLTPTGGTLILGGDLLIGTGEATDERLTRNTLELLDVLYGHGVTSPHVLRLALQTLGHREDKIPAPQPGSESPTPHCTATRAGPQD